MLTTDSPQAPSIRPLKALLLQHQLLLLLMLMLMLRILLPPPLPLPNAMQRRGRGDSACPCSWTDKCSLCLRGCIRHRLPPFL